MGKQRRKVEAKRGKGVTKNQKKKQRRRKFSTATNVLSGRG